jgi:hypothetical protein
MICLELIDHRLPADRAVRADRLDDPMEVSDRRFGVLQGDAAGLVQARIVTDHTLLADRVYIEGEWLIDLFIRHESNRDQLIVAEW